MTNVVVTKNTKIATNTITSSVFVAAVFVMVISCLATVYDEQGDARGGRGGGLTTSTIGAHVAKPTSRRINRPSLYTRDIFNARMERSMQDEAVRSGPVLYQNTTVNWVTQIKNHSANPGCRISSDNDNISSSDDGNSSSSNDTFQQRWWVDYTAWDNQSNIAMLYIGGESAESSSPYNWATYWGYSVNAVLFTLEHRWYGESVLGDYTDVEQLKSLTIDEALDDLKCFTEYVNSEVMGRNMTWVAVGGSYAGALSAWFKVKYPDATAAAWSSSGVVNPRFDYAEYDGKIHDVMDNDCRETISLAYRKAEDISHDPVAFADTLKLFNLTDDNYTIVDLASTLASPYQGGTQYSLRTELCEHLVPRNHTHPLEQYARMTEWVNAELGGGGGGDDSAGTLWIYQCCTEVAYWQIGSPHGLLPDYVDTTYSQETCIQVFGDVMLDVFPNLYSWNTKMGGAHPNATHVIALQGSDDPFGPAGVNEQVNPDYPFVLAQCDDCGHCGDLDPEDSNEPESRMIQRRYIIQYMNKWLNLTQNLTLAVNASGIPVTPKDIRETGIAPASHPVRDTIQSYVLIALNATGAQHYHWVSAMVYNCESTSTPSSTTATTTMTTTTTTTAPATADADNDVIFNCGVSFPNSELRDLIMDLANTGRITRVINASIPTAGAAPLK